MNKNFFYLIALGMFFPSASLHPKNSSLLKNRTVLRLESKNLHKIMKEIGTDSSENAIKKITGVQTLFDELQVDDATQALSTLENLRQEFKQTIESIEKKYSNKITMMESEKNQMLQSLNVDSVEKVVEKFKQAQSTHEQIVQFAQQLKK